MTERCDGCGKRRMTAMDPGGIDLCSDCTVWAAERDREKDAEILRLRKIIHRARSLNDRQSNDADQWGDMDRILREVEVSADADASVEDEVQYVEAHRGDGDRNYYRGSTTSGSSTGGDRD